MHTNDFFMCQHQFFQLLHRFHICRLSQKIANCIPNDVESRFQNEQRNCRTHNAVHRQRCHQRQQQCQNGCSGSRHIAAAVLRRGDHHRGLYPFPQFGVEPRHPKLDSN